MLDLLQPLVSVWDEGVLNYSGAFRPQSGVSLAEARIKDIVDNVTLSRYLLKQSRSSYVLYLRFGLLMKRNSDVSTLLKSLNEGLGKWIVLAKLYPNSKLLFDKRGGFVFLLTQAADFYMKKHTESLAFHVCSFYQFGEHFLQKLYNLRVGVSIFLKPNFLALMKENLSKDPGEGRSIKQLYSNSMQSSCRTQRIGKSDGHEKLRLWKRIWYHASKINLKKLRKRASTFKVRPLQCR